MQEDFVAWNTRAIALPACDVVVAGGGPAGIAAAIAAARQGLRTLLLEGNGCVGGTCTSGALPFWLGAYNGSIPYKQMLQQGLAYRDLPRPRRAVRGIFEELMQKIRAADGGVGPCALGQTARYPGLDRLGCHDEFTFDLEIGKRVMERAILDAGAAIRYYAHVLGARRAGDRVLGVYFADKSGVQYVPAGVVIDCTGDADVTAAAGFATYTGDRRTGEMTAASLVAHLENIDAAAMEEYLNAGGDPWFRPACCRARAENPADDFPERLILFPMVQAGVFMINGGTSFSGYDGTNGEDMTRLSVAGRARAEALVRLFRGYIPGGAHCRLRLTAAYPGVRETRRIQAEYMLTEEDLLDGAVFPDTVALAGRHFDLCRAQGQVFADQHKTVKRGITAIPYRAMLPKGADNLLAAGRCIGADGQALGPVRIMSTCFALGEAAGVAAALKIAAAVPLRAIDVAALRERLRRNHAEIDA